MKKYLFVFSLSLFVIQINAQDQTINGTTFKQDGKVGVGTSSPNYKLDVNGDVSTKSLYIPDLGVSGTSLLKVGNDTFFTDIDVANTIGLYGAQDSSKGGLRLGSSGSYLFGSNGNVGVGVINPNEKLQIGNAFSFHDGGHEVIGFNYSASGATDLDSNKYAAEIRFDGVNGVLNIGVSSSLTNAPSSKLLISKDGNINFSGPLSIPDLGVPGIKHLSIGNDTFFTDTDAANIIGLYGAQDNSKGGLRLGSSGPSLFGSNGNIGIGTTSPNSKLEVNGDITVGNSTTVGSYINVVGAGSHQSFGLQLGSAANADSRASILSHTTTGDLSFSVQENLAMTINGSGDVGIGTSYTHGFKLGVDGAVAALEVKIATYGNWPDYVFNDTYNLPTLKEVESHIKEKGHLKNIPSAEEIKKDGFFLGDMNSKLLQKIEELTLYTIEQEKRIEAQNNELQSQKEKIEKLEEDNEVLKSLFERVKKLEEKIKL